MQEIGWKSTVIHYKSIKFNIRIILNITHSQFSRRAARAKCYINAKNRLKALYIIHYITIKFIHNSQFFGALRAQSVILMQE